MHLYNIHGKRISVAKAASERQEFIGRQFDSLLSADKLSTHYNEASHTLETVAKNSEMQHYLSKDERLPSSHHHHYQKLKRNPNSVERLIQSAGSRLLLEFTKQKDEIEVLGEGEGEEEKEDGMMEKVYSADWNLRSNQYLRSHYSLSNNECDPDSVDVTRRSSLKYGIINISEKIRDNERTDINTFSYLLNNDEISESKSILSEESDKRSNVNLHDEKLGFPEDDDDEENEEEDDDDDETQQTDPTEIFKSVLIVTLLIKVTLNNVRLVNGNIQTVCKKRPIQTFVELQKNITASMSNSEDGIGFDKYAFKINNDKYLTQDAIQLLTIPFEFRTEAGIQTALASVLTTIDAFGEFPIIMQHEIISKAWYEKYEESRTIIRQGQTPINFYFIISGSVVVSVTRKDKVTGEPYEETIAFLKAGHSFGELALVYGGRRSATITARTAVELLVMSKDAFQNIFMNTSGDVDSELEYIEFIRSISLIPKNVIDQLSILKDNSVLLFTYFRRNTTICIDSSKNDWIYIIKSGQCRVLKDVLLKDSYSNHQSEQNDHEKLKQKTKSNQYRLYLELKVLQPKSIFGLETVVFRSHHGSNSASLISDGAECVAIKKSFFVEHCPPTFMNYLRRVIQPFPDSSELERKLYLYREWRAYCLKEIKRTLKR